MLSEKILFSKKQYGFFTTLADPPPPGLAKDHKKYGFFLEPFPYVFVFFSMMRFFLTHIDRVYFTMRRVSLVYLFIINLPHHHVVELGFD